MNQKLLKRQIKNLSIASMLLAVGMALPFLTGQIPQIGSMLLPMHLPALICGLICGWQYGGLIGFILPLFRNAVFGMPPMPTALAMAFELAAYGIFAGFLYGYSRWKCMVALYRSLIVAMIGGRIVWGMAQIIIFGISGKAFTWQMFLSGAFLMAIPGIILQLVFIPALMAALNRTGIVTAQAGAKKEQCIRKI